MTKKLTHAGIVKMGDELFVRGILDEMEGKSNTVKAEAIVKRLGKRMRAYERKRTPVAEDVNQAAFRTIREATK